MKVAPTESASVGALPQEFEIMPRPLLLATFLLSALLAASRVEAAIPLINGTCPGGIEVHADEGGPVYVNGRETRLQRFNDDYYEARDVATDTTLSINRTPDGGVQMSYAGKGGANGICSIGGTPPGDGDRTGDRDASHDGGAAPVGARAGAAVTCESHGNEQAECEMDTRGDVQLVRQLSRSDCVRGQNWGLNRHSVWVKDGCRAEFRNLSRAGDHGSDHPAGQGGELLGACNVRAGASGALVTRVPVNDDVTELIVDYPDGRFLCMVRNDGQVQSLTRMRKR